LRYKFSELFCCYFFLVEFEFEGGGGFYSFGELEGIGSEFEAVWLRSWDWECVFENEVEPGALQVDFNFWRWNLPCYNEV